MKIWKAVFVSTLRLLVFRSGYFLASLIFAFGLFALFRFTLPVDSISRANAIAIFWSAFFISAIYLIASSQEWEWEHFAYRLIRIYEKNTTFYLLGRMSAIFLCLLFAYFTYTFLWSILYGNAVFPKGVLLSHPFWKAVLVSGFLVSFGLATVGELASVIAIHSRFKQLSMFTMMLPLSIPITLTAAQLCRMSFEKNLQYSNYLPTLLAFDFVFLGATLLLYEYLLEE